MPNFFQINIDMMKLNKCVVRSTYPLQLFGKQFQHFHLPRFITTLDATHGYWQIPLAENDQIQTTHGFTWQRASAANAAFSDVDTPQKVDADVIVYDETSPEHVYVPVNL